jgi:hypothetical protein
LKQGDLGTSRIIGHVVEKFEMTFGAAEGLHRFTDQVQFFSPALLYLYGRFTDEPFVQFMAEQGEIKLMHHHFKQPIFLGFEAGDGDKAWNHVLWGVLKEHYEALENYILSVVLTSVEERWMARVGAQDVTILDPLQIDKQKIINLEVPTIPIVVWGLDTNHLALSVETENGDPFLRPKIRTHEPQPETVAEANAMYTGKNALEAREASIQEQEGAEDEGNA